MQGSNKSIVQAFLLKNKARFVPQPLFIPSLTYYIYLILYIVL